MRLRPRTPAREADEATTPLTTPEAASEEPAEPEPEPAAAEPEPEPAAAEPEPEPRRRARARTGAGRR